MVLDWAVRGVLFYCRMVSGRWLWKYPRARFKWTKQTIFQAKRYFLPKVENKSANDLNCENSL
jgi:hypothetical protein